MTYQKLSPSPFMRKFHLVMDLSDDERAILQGLEYSIKSVKPLTELLIQGAPYRGTYILRDGWAVRYKTLPDGKRQILDFVLPGDCVGLAALVFQRTDHAVITVTPASVSMITPSRMLEVFRNDPRLGAALYWTVSQEEAVIAEHLVNIGRRDAYMRLGHLFLELFWRLDAVGLVADHTYAFPLSQPFLADALGLSLVHVNRTLQRLQKDGLLLVNDRQVTILDLDALEDTVQFESTYLHLLGMPLWLRKRLALNA